MSNVALDFLLLKSGDTLKTIRHTREENWLKRFVKNYPNIPSGEDIKFISTIRTPQDFYLKIEYHNRFYRINPCNVICDNEKA